MTPKRLAFSEGKADRQHQRKNAQQVDVSTPGHLEQELENLKEPVVSWKYILKHLIGRKFGGKRLTYAQVTGCLA